MAALNSAGIQRIRGQHPFVAPVLLVGVGAVIVAGLVDPLAVLLIGLLALAALAGATMMRARDETTAAALGTAPELPVGLVLDTDVGIGAM